MPHLAELTRPDLIFPGLAGTDTPSILRELSQRLQATGRVASAETVFERLFEREQLQSTGIGHGVAIPHCKLVELPDVLVAVGIADQGVDFAAVDGKPVRLFFLVVSPARSPAAHLQSLASISKWVKKDDHVSRLLEMNDAGAIHDFIRQQPA